MKSYTARFLNFIFSHYTHRHKITPELLQQLFAILSLSSPWQCPSGASLFGWCRAGACEVRRRWWHLWTTPTAAWRRFLRRSSASRRRCRSSTSMPTRSRNCLKYDIFERSWKAGSQRKIEFALLINLRVFNRMGDDGSSDNVRTFKPSIFPLDV